VSESKVRATASFVARLLRDVADALDEEMDWPYSIVLERQVVDVSSKDADWSESIAGSIEKVTVQRL